VVREIGDVVRLDGGTAARDAIVVRRDGGVSARRHDRCRCNLVVGQGEIAVVRDNDGIERSAPASCRERSA
jgi:hypothetical protein